MTEGESTGNQAINQEVWFPIQLRDLRQISESWKQSRVHRVWNRALDTSPGCVTLTLSGLWEAIYLWGAESQEGLDSSTWGDLWLVFSPKFCLAAWDPEMDQIYAILNEGLILTLPKINSPFLHPEKGELWLSSDYQRGRFKSLIPTCFYACLAYL